MARSCGTVLKADYKVLAQYTANKIKIDNENLMQVSTNPGNDGGVSSFLDDVQIQGRQISAFIHCTGVTENKNLESLDMQNIFWVNTSSFFKLHKICCQQ